MNWERNLAPGYRKATIEDLAIIKLTSDQRSAMAAFARSRGQEYVDIPDVPAAGNTGPWKSGQEEGYGVLRIPLSVLEMKLN
ncbi:MAG: hypothetical protein LRZ85_09820 [Alphaproteobacteria bacterium]|nr:hypothetical protein [Alphaproteobacteria bacterium]MCD8520463.1 hypothetical protein [Alphaproteobacteria bacterium]MCD8571156.1 hypothetical protein [Alphaproteobacteria bacterium]